MAAASVAMTGLLGGAGIVVAATSADAAVRSCSASTPASQRPVLRYKDSGSCVVQAQKRLQAHGFGVGASGADGSFGPATLGAVQRFQKAKGLTVDGYVGPRTWAKLVGATSGSPTPPPSGGGSYNKYTCGNNGNKVLLVFDDYSPTGSKFRALINAAKANNIGIGVAPNGNAVAAGRADVNYARSKGMLVIDHTWDHRDLTRLSNAQIAWQITRPQINSNYVRPPYGATNARVQGVLNQYGKYNCLWNLDPQDWNGKSPYSAANYIIRNARRGSTAVVHLNHMGTDATTLGYIKRGLAARGIQMCAPWSTPTTHKMPPTYCR